MGKPKSHREGFWLLASIFLIPLCLAGAVVLVTKVIRNEWMELSYVGLNTAIPDYSPRAPRLSSLRPI